MEDKQLAETVVRGGATAEKSYRYTYAIMGCVRWEDQDIAEWVEYHRAVGFDHVYVYSNDDDPRACFRALQPYLFGPAPFVTFKHFPKRNPGHPQQQDIYLHFLSHFKDETEWVSLLDVDEFFVFKNVDNVHAFMAPFTKDYDSVYFNWLLFGHNGKAERDGNSIPLSHTMRAARIDVHTKTITRTSKIDPVKVRRSYATGARGFWHFWEQYELGMRITNVLRDDITGYAIDFPRSAVAYLRARAASEPMIDTAFVAHFQFKSEADFLRRVNRGGSHTVPYWKKTLEDGSFRARLAQANQVRDTYLAAFWLRHAGSGFDITTEVPQRQPSLRNRALANLALRKPSWQSSIHVQTATDPAWCAVLGHANNGHRSGGYGFRTLAEEAPWWCVDLLAPCRIVEVHVYNRMDDPAAVAQARHLVVAVSVDGAVWRDIHRLDGGTDVGGVGRAPLCIVLAAPVTARLVRIGSSQPAQLHLDEVEVYGERIEM